MWLLKDWKHLVHLPVIVLALTLAGCSTEVDPTQAPSTEVPAAEASTTETPAPEATAVPQDPVEAQEEDQPMAFRLMTQAFEAGNPIPARYTCDAENLSPELSWTDPPTGTRSFALIMDDPDAPVGTWVHWVLFNLPGDSRGLAEGMTSDAEFDDGSRHGENSWGNLGYGGPCPPSGTHRYFFKLYALDAQLELASGASKVEVLEAMEGHVLADSEWMGTYTR